MKILIVYGTTEGQTRKIASHMAARVDARGHSAEVLDATALPAHVPFDDYDALITAASVHQYQHQASVFHFVRAYQDELNRKPSAFVSVSLSAAREQERPEAQACADQFLADTGWRPSETHLVAGALRYTQYDFFKRQIMKLIASTAGGPMDGGQDFEFTDWDDLDAFTDAFLEAASRPPAEK